MRSCANISNSPTSPNSNRKIVIIMLLCSCGHHTHSHSQRDTHFHIEEPQRFIWFSLRFVLIFIRIRFFFLHKITRALAYEQTDRHMHIAHSCAHTRCSWCFLIDVLPTLHEHASCVCVVGSLFRTSIRSFLKHRRQLSSSNNLRPVFVLHECCCFSFVRFFNSFFIRCLSHSLYFASFALFVQPHTTTSATTIFRFVRWCSVFSVRCSACGIYHRPGADC